MKKINEQSTKVFCQLLKRLGNNEDIKLRSEGFMPLTFEKLEENILTHIGVATTYSLAHNYTQNGDTMRDLEMVFIVIDNRATSEKGITAVAIYPAIFQQDNLAIYEQSITIENGQIESFIKTWQHSHCNFANKWLQNIRQQGFLK